MDQTPSPLLLPPVSKTTITRDFLARQALELADMARSRKEIALSLECLGFVAQMKNFLDDADADGF